VAVTLDDLRIALIKLHKLRYKGGKFYIQASRLLNEEVTENTLQLVQDLTEEIK
jgi:hypothetical protein